MSAKATNQLGNGSGTADDPPVETLRDLLQKIEVPTPDCPRPVHPSDMITQAEIRELAELLEPHRRHDQLRRSIIERLDAGVEVEHGELGINLYVESRQVPKWAELERCLPPETIEHLRVNIVRTPVRHLRIIDAHGRTHGWGMPEQLLILPQYPWH